MPIDKLTKNEAVRESVQTSYDKINEIIDVVNAFSNESGNIETIQQNVTQLQSDVSLLTSDNATNKTDIKKLQSDVDNIKITLYTPINEEV